MNGNSHNSALIEMLNNVFSNAVKCNFEKAKEYYKKDKLLACNFGELWTLLPDLLNYERCYVEFAFLAFKSKGAAKKSNFLKNDYNAASIKLASIAKLHGTEANMDVSDVLFELLDYVEMRVKLIEVYSKLYADSCFNKHAKLDEAVSMLERLIKMKFPASGKTLACVYNILEMETRCLFDLLSIQHHLENWRMLPCTAHLISLSARLPEWEKMLQTKETWRVNFIRTTSQPDIVRWFLKFQTFVSEKYSLYFYDSMKECADSPTELKTFYIKNHLELLQRIENGPKRTSDLKYVMLVFDATTGKNFDGPGFCCSLRKREDAREKLYRIMFSHPEMKDAEEEGKAVEKLMRDKSGEIFATDKLVSHHNAAGTFFAVRGEDKITLVAHYNGKREDRESEIAPYLTDLAAALRSDKIFACLNKCGPC